MIKIIIIDLMIEIARDYYCNMVVVVVIVDDVGIGFLKEINFKLAIMKQFFFLLTIS